MLPVNNTFLISSCKNIAFPSLGSSPVFCHKWQKWFKRAINRQESCCFGFGPNFLGKGFIYHLGLSRVLGLIYVEKNENKRGVERETERKSERDCGRVLGPRGQGVVIDHQMLKSVTPAETGPAPENTWLSVSSHPTFAAHGNSTTQARQHLLSWFSSSVVCFSYLVSRQRPGSHLFFL